MFFPIQQYSTFFGKINSFYKKTFFACKILPSLLKYRHYTPLEKTMKRVSAPLILLILCLSLALWGCEFFPTDTPNGPSVDVGNTDSGAGEDNTPETDVGKDEKPKEEHFYESTRVPATCETDGYTLFTCKHCADSFVGAYTVAYGHAEKTIPGKAATCTEAGLSDGAECYRCKAVIKEQTVIPAHGHSYTTVTTEPTCDKWGYAEGVCDICGYSCELEKLPAKGHTPITVPGKAATCLEDGLSNGEICDVCGKFLKQQTTVPSLGHSYAADITLPTCEAEGYTTYTCSVCQDSYVGDKIPKKGHDERIIPGKAATATEDGLSDGLECRVCAKVLVEQTVISAYGHNYIATVTAPGCEEVGYTTYTCADCGEEYVSDMVPALGHVERKLPGKAASCEEEGLEEGIVCERCDKLLKAQTAIPKEKHSYVEKVKEPDCEEAGYTTATCSVCGHHVVSEIIPALGHNETPIKGYGATCVEDGLTDGLKCSRCERVLTPQTAIPKTGHSYSDKVTPPTCEAQGYTEHTCSVCGHSYTSDITSALGHDERTIKGEAASCAKEGLTDGVLCARCDVIIVEQTVIARTSHSYAKKTVAPKCETEGYTLYVCAVCSDSYVSNRTSALGHDWQQATTEAPKTCRVCGKCEGDKLPEKNDPTLTVTYIDVGQGDSILIKIEDCDILIDAGVANCGSTVSSYLKNQGVDDIELMINTHPDADHCGGLTTVLNNFVVEKVWGSHLTKTTAAYKNFSSAVSKEGLKVVTPAVGEVFCYGEMTLTVLYNGMGTSDSNDSSIVVMVEYGEASFIFTGDISSDIERKLVSEYGSGLECDVIKVAHHGSRYSSCKEFLNACSSSYGVICVGAGNSYGHPTSQALSRLSSAGITVYRTDLCGHVVFTSDGSDPKLVSPLATAYRSELVGIVTLTAFAKNVGIIPKRFAA